MEFNKCSRCGNFYVSQGNVCPNCETKDAFEFSTFKNFVKENELTSNLDANGLAKISMETGIAMKHINRFVSYTDFGDQKNATAKNIVKEKGNKKI